MASFEEVAEATSRAFDRACQATAGHPRWSGVYVSPLWEVEAGDAPGTVRGWKRSVLRRVPGAGAEPWGHVFLVVTASADAVARVEELGLGPIHAHAGGKAVPVSPPLWEGPPRAQLFLRPRSPATAERLQAFVEELREEFTPPAGVAGATA